MSYSTCEEHGHYCPTCNFESENAEYVAEVKKRVESWFWDKDIFEIYEDIKHEDENLQSDLLAYAKARLDGDANKLVGELQYHFGVDEKGEFGIDWSKV